MIQPANQLEKKFPISIRLVIGFLGVFAFLVFLNVAKDVLIPITLSLIFSLVLYPFCIKVEKWGASRTWAVIIVMVASFLLMAVILSLLSAQVFALSKDLPELIIQLKGRVATFSVWLQKTAGMDESQLLKTAEDSLGGLAKSGGGLVTSLLGSASSFFTLITIIPIMVAMMLLYRKQLRVAITAMVKDEHQTELDHISQHVRQVLRSYVAGLTTVMLVVGILNSLGLWILGIPYPLFFGVLGALLTIIPYIGLLIGGTLPVLMAIITKDNPVLYGLGVVGVFGAVQFLEANFLTPRIVGGKVSVNPLAAIIALMAGGMVWGTVGLIVALPIVAVIKVISDEIPALKPLGLLLGMGDEKHVTPGRRTGRVGRAKGKRR